MRKHQTVQEQAYASVKPLPIGEPAEPLRIFVVIGGGLVQGVYCTDEAAQVLVIDHDADYDDEAAWTEKETNRKLCEELYEAQALHLVM